MHCLSTTFCPRCLLLTLSYIDARQACCIPGHASLSKCIVCAERTNTSIQTMIWAESLSQLEKSSSIFSGRRSRSHPPLSAYLATSSFYPSATRNPCQRGAKFDPSIEVAVQLWVGAIARPVQTGVLGSGRFDRFADLCIKNFRGKEIQ